MTVEPTEPDQVMPMPPQLSPGAATITQGDITVTTHIHTVHSIPGRLATAYAIEGFVGLSESLTERRVAYHAVRKQRRLDFTAESGDLATVNGDDLQDQILNELTRCDFENLSVPFDRHAIADRLMDVIADHVEWSEL